MAPAQVPRIGRPLRLEALEARVRERFAVGLEIALEGEDGDAGLERIGHIRDCLCNWIRVQ